MNLGDYYLSLLNGALPDNDNMLERLQNSLGRDLIYQRLSSYEYIGQSEKEAITRDYLNSSPVGLNYDYINQYLRNELELNDTTST